MADSASGSPVSYNSHLVSEIYDRQPDRWTTWIITIAGHPQCGSQLIIQLSRNIVAIVEVCGESFVAFYMQITFNVHFTIRDAILTCARKPTLSQLNLPHGNDN